MNNNIIQNPVPILQQYKSNIVTNPLITGTINRDMSNDDPNYSNNLFNYIKDKNKDNIIVFAIVIFVLGIVSSFFF